MYVPLHSSAYFVIIKMWNCRENVICYTAACKRYQKIERELGPGQSF